ncbi:MAG: 3-dehydroquinate dehydratase [Acidobacteria bacterium]|nr:3-dehydroquinate dehydratase [Acidobacteriota bacterium]
MPRVLLVHGPNLNRLGRRDPQHYGRITLDELEQRVRGWAAPLGVELRAFQSNHEGTLIDFLQDQAEWADGALVNFGALTHSSYALHDALLDFGRPVVEVHLSKISQREPWRRVSVVRPACAGFVEGLGADGYRAALELLLGQL